MSPSAPTSESAAACASPAGTTTPQNSPHSLKEMFRNELESLGIQGGVWEGEGGGRPVFWMEKPPRDFFGLALSGGGIRSATFGLGVLQGLSNLGILKHFHYLSTVSGGGYIGGFWSAWRKRQQEQCQDGKAEKDVFPTEVNGAESPHVRHLREFSNFLSPRLGLFNMETGNIASALVASIVPSLLGALSAIVLLLYTWVFLAWVLFTRPLGYSLGTLLGGALVIQIVFERAWWTCSRAERQVRGLGAYVASVLLALLSAGVFWALWSRQPRLGEWFHLLPPLPPFEPALLDLSGRFGSVAVVVESIRGLGPVQFLASFGTVLGSKLFAPAGALAAAALVLVMVRWILTPSFTDFKRRARRGAIDRALSRVLFAALAWLAVAGLWRVALTPVQDELPGWLSAFGLAGGSFSLAGLGGGLFSWARKLLGEQPSKPQVGGFTERLKPLVPQILAYLTIALLVIGCAATILAFAWRWNDVVVLRLLPLWVALGFMVLTLLRFQPNELGFHSFYRGRLGRAYLGAANLERQRFTADCESDDFALRELPKTLPYHLVCCTANDLAGDHLANLHRGARSAVLSQAGYSVGEDWVDWKGVPDVSLASAMTASGAAFNSHMGSKSMAWGPAVTFLMTALNLRLGLWLPHPLHARDSGGGLPGLPFYKELFGISKASAPKSKAGLGDPALLGPCAVGKQVHLSDGGHFENMGLYELIRRHCRYILVSDCGADPDVAFDDLGNAVRRVREDFGVEIDIDLRPLRPGPDGLALQPMVAGDIRYPGGDSGVILLVKPTLVGNEPADILQYKRRNAAFPHETTGDQFYDEAQWESYRRLGKHAAGSAFRFLLQNPSDCGAEVFARARFEWLPVPEAAREGFPRLAARITDLEEQLRDVRCTRLMREVYKEIDELDRQAKRPPAPPVTESEGDRRGGGSVPETTSVPGLNPDELAASLQVIRQAVLLMEEVFFFGGLEGNADHPVNLGWLNYFARWAYSPLFRMWWPLLKTLYHARLTRFLEDRFDLPHLRAWTPNVEEVSGTVERGGRGFASECWERRMGAKVEPTPAGGLAAAQTGGKETPAPPAGQGDGKQTWQYLLQVQYEGTEPYRVQAALVRLRKKETVAAWEAEDFFVPPGLWGVGIGEDFLRLLPKALGIGMLVVRFPANHTGGLSRRRERTTDSQLYRCHGFQEAWYKDQEGLVDPVTGRPLGVDLDTLFGPDTQGQATKSCWFFRRTSSELPAPRPK